MKCLDRPMNSYKILAPSIMDEEPNPKIATQKCLESTTLDPDFYRIGHTKARQSFSLMIWSYQCFVFIDKNFIFW